VGKGSPIRIGRREAGLVPRSWCEAGVDGQLFRVRPLPQPRRRGRKARPAPAGDPCLHRRRYPLTRRPTPRKMDFRFVSLTSLLSAFFPWRRRAGSSNRPDIRGGVMTADLTQRIELCERKFAGDKKRLDELTHLRQRIVEEVRSHGQPRLLRSSIAFYP